MAGIKSGVSTRFLEIEKRSLFIHCQGHKTSLSSGDTIKGCIMLENALSYSNEIIKSLKKSPKRTAEFEQLKREIGEPTIGNKPIDIKNLLPLLLEFSL